MITDRLLASGVDIAVTHLQAPKATGMTSYVLTMNPLFGMLSKRFQAQALLN